MKKVRIPLYKYIMILISLFAISGCTFKKSGEKSSEPAGVMSHAVVLDDVSSVMSSQDDKYIIEQLILHKDVYLATSDQKQKALDVAILFSKYEIIKKLLLYGINPFKISNDSYRQIDINSKIGGLLLSSQGFVIDRLVKSYPLGQSREDLPDESSNSNTFRNSRPYMDFIKAVDSAELGLRGCQTLVDSFFNIRYFDHGSRAQEISTFDAIKDVTGRTVCQQYINSFSLELVQKWLSFEYYDEYQNNFKFIEMMKFLKELRPVRTLNIVLPNVREKTKIYGKYISNSQLKVDPLAMLFLKLPCISYALKDQWYNLIKELRDDADNEQLFKIQTEGQPYLPTCAKEELGTCYAYGNNLLEMYVLFNLTISTQPISLDNFKKVQLEVLNPPFLSEGEYREDRLPFFGVLCSEQKL